MYTPQGAFYLGNTYQGGFANLEPQSVAYNFDASRSSSTYQDNVKVKPDTLYSNFIIKY